LSLDQIAGRLNDRFQLLRGGSRTALPRQQTLRAAIDWSYDLLSDSERALLRRLSVFADGTTLDAAEAVCSGKPIGAADVLELLTELVSKSLVLVDQGRSGRYELLETIRNYGEGKLHETVEAEDISRRHRDWFLSLAERAEPQLRGPDQTAWYNTLELEHDNLRAAFDWSLIRQEPDAGLRLVTAM